MKYGILTYMDDIPFNIGDGIEGVVIRELYKSVGIPDKDIIEICVDELTTYDGEYVLCIINFFLSDWLPFSERIIPVFFGTHIESKWDAGTVDYLKRYEPIGCRDEATMKRLRQWGVQAFMTGCLTLTFPKRTVEPEVFKTFFIDIPEDLENFIPQSIRENAEYDSHIAELDGRSRHHIAISQLERYKNEASLIVTSRVHCASPCLAMGIPVIMVCRLNPFPTCGFIDRFIPIYSTQRYGAIEWEPKSINLESEKTIIWDTAVGMLKDAIRKFEAITSLSYFYENNQKNYYNNTLQVEEGYMSFNEQTRMLVKDYLSVLLKNITKSEPATTDLIIWGVGSNARLLLSKIMEISPRYRSIIFVDNDKDKQGHFINPDIFASLHYGGVRETKHINQSGFSSTDKTDENCIPIYSPEVIREYDRKTTVILISPSEMYAGTIADQLTSEYGLFEGKDYWLFYKIMLGMNQYLEALKLSL